jgi:hypothetical protein
LKLATITGQKSGSLTNSLSLRFVKMTCELACGNREKGPKANMLWAFLVYEKPSSALHQT